MEELIIKDPDELKGIVAGFLRRLAIKKVKPSSPRKRINLTKSAERYVERLKKEGKIAPDAKFTIIAEEKSLPLKGKKDGSVGTEDIMKHPSVVDAYISYLKREDHIEPFTSKIVELIIDRTELTPEEKEKTKKVLGGLFSVTLRSILSLKTDLRADLRDGHIALINKAIKYARDKGILPKEVFESDEHFKKFRRIRGVQGF